MVRSANSTLQGERTAMLRMLSLLLLAGAAMAGVAPGARAEMRIALLIGNQNYNAKVGALKNPLDDIALMGAALDRLGFMTTLVQDADYRTIDTAIKRHVLAVRREGQGTVSFLYYSGHGAADPETKINYLIPVDVANADDDDLWYYSLNLNDVIDTLRLQAPKAIHYVVFDACRNELRLTKKGVKALSDRGFYPMTYAPGMIVAYATAPGRTASDTGEGGGIFARVLAEEIVKPGVDSMLVFTRTARRVQQEIGQDPFLSASTMPELYFANNASPSVPAATAPAAFVPEAVPQPIEAERGWSAVKDSKSIAVLETFVAHFKDSFYAELAQARVGELRRQEASAEVAARPAPPAALPFSPPASPAMTSQARPLVAVAQPPAADPADLARSLQLELKRVGCLSGEADGVWGEQSRSALRTFAKQAGLDIGDDGPSEVALAAASGASTRLCPPSCDEGERLVNGRCVARERVRHAQGRTPRERESRTSSRVRGGSEQPRSGGALCFGAERGGPLVPCK
jgi:uncharacterized caspase-like protein